MRQKFDVSPFAKILLFHLIKKKKKKFVCGVHWSSQLVSVQHRFQPQNPLSGAQTFSPREAGTEEEEMMKLSAHTLLLPTRGQLEARMMVTAFEMGLDNVTEDAVSTVVYALEVCVCVWSSVSSGWNNPASYDMFLYVLKNKCTAVYLKRNKFYYYVCLNYPSCCSGAFKRPHHRSGVSEKSLPSERGTFPVRLRQWRRTAAVPEEQPGCVPHRHRIVSHFTVFSF